MNASVRLQPPFEPNTQPARFSPCFLLHAMPQWRLLVRFIINRHVYDQTRTILRSFFIFSKARQSSSKGIEPSFFLFKHIALLLFVYIAQGGMWWPPGPYVLFLRGCSGSSGRAVSFLLIRGGLLHPLLLGLARLPRLERPRCRRFSKPQRQPLHSAPPECPP